MCNVGFHPLLHKIKEIVQEHIESNKLKIPFKKKAQVKNGLNILYNTTE